MEKLREFVDSLSEEELEILKGYSLGGTKEPPIRIEIPYKFPSLNEYTQACRTNAYAGASMKKKVQRDIGLVINTLPVFVKPVVIKFTWVEGNKKRDLDNIAFAKKFILDALVECGKLKDDNRKVVTAFRDNFEYGDDWKVILEIREVEDEET